VASSREDNGACLEEIVFRNEQSAGGSVTHPSRSSAIHLPLCFSKDSRIEDALVNRVENEPVSSPDDPTTPSPSRETIVRQLGRILQSKAFVQSDKLSRFLRFVVEHVLEGNAGVLKEYVIGVEVYDRRPPYNPSQDSIVRTEARRLRNKLKEYYGAEGKGDPLYVYLRPGSYVPVFQSSQDLLGAADSAEQKVFLPERSCSILTAILPFRDISKIPISSTYARGLPDELACALMPLEGCTVISPSRLTYFNPQKDDLVTTMDKVGAQIAFEGTVRVEGRRLRITARIVDASGIQLWVKRIDVEGVSESSFAIEEQIALALSTGFHDVRSSSVLRPSANR